MKKVGIMQPYFFPYLGYISLIKHTDEFILFDPVQFIRHGWIERNRVLKQGGNDWIYIRVPLQNGKQDVLIKDVLIDNGQNWKGKILSQLQPYKKFAPHYRDVIGLLGDIFAHDYNDITSLNIATLKAVCRYLNIGTPLTIFSQMNLKIEEPHAPDEWALNICKALGDVDEYWNPPGGQDFFNKSKYEVAGITLRFQKPEITQYKQMGNDFIPGLSIIDVLMFNSPEEVNRMLDNYELI